MPCFRLQFDLMRDLGLPEVLCSENIAFLHGCALDVDGQEHACHNAEVSPRCIVGTVNVRIRAFNGRQASDGFWQDKALKLLRIRVAKFKSGLPCLQKASHCRKGCPARSGKTVNFRYNSVLSHRRHFRALMLHEL